MVPNGAVADPCNISIGNRPAFIAKAGSAGSEMPVSAERADNMHFLVCKRETIAQAVWHRRTFHPNAHRPYVKGHRGHAVVGGGVIAQAGEPAVDHNAENPS